MSVKPNYVYEVNILGPNDVKNDFSRWLDGHIQDMLDLPMFYEAEIDQLDSLGDCFVYRVKYFLNNVDQLQEYFEDHAGTMRSDLPVKFQEVLKFSRFHYAGKKSNP